MRILAGILCVTASWSAFSEDLSERIDAVFAEYAKPGSPGVQCAVMLDDEVVYNKGFGLAQLEYAIPVSTETVFHVASVSKQFTVFAIVLLALDGDLSLDDDIRKHLPDFPDLGETVTIRHLIHHASGIRDQWELALIAGWRMEDVITQDDLMGLLRAQRELNFKPGDQHLYSNSGFTLLAEIVRSVSGKSLKAFTTERMFEPLGMTHTHFHDDHHHIVSNRAYSYGRTGDEGYENIVLSYANCGATSLFTTGADLMKWQRNLETGNVGGPEAVELMQQQGTLNDGRTISYGFGIGHSHYKGLRTIAHGGADAGFRSHLVRFPDQDCSIAILSNLAQTDSSDLSFAVAEIVLEDHFSEPADDEENRAESGTDAKTLDAFTGAYWHAPTNTIYKLTQRDGVLRVSAGNAPPTELTADGDRVFRTVDPPDRARIEVLLNGNGSVKQIEVNTPNSVQTICTPLERVSRRDIDLEAYIGRYYSPETDAFVDFTYDGKRLQMGRRKDGPYPANPIYEDIFSCDRETISFDRDLSGTITGMRVRYGRVLNLRYKRVPDMRSN